MKGILLLKEGNLHSSRYFRLAWIREYRKTTYLNECEKYSPTGRPSEKTWKLGAPLCLARWSRK